jgi:hypothetical protein
VSDDKPHFCPRCRSPRDDVMRLTTFSCGSRVEPRWESGECLRRRIVILEQENATLVERVARLQDECRIALIRAERAEERVRRLEEAGDALFNIAGKIGHGLFVAETKDAWIEAKATP